MPDAEVCDESEVEPPASSASTELADVRLWASSNALILPDEIRLLLNPETAADFAGGADVSVTSDSAGPKTPAGRDDDAAGDVSD